MKLLTLLLIVAAALAAPAAAQDRDGHVISLPELKKETVIVREIAFDFDLPRGELLKIDDTTLTQADLLKQLLRDHLHTIADTLLNTKMVELEMEREGVDVTGAEMNEELDEMLPRIAPDKTLDEIVESGIYSRSYLEQMARVNRGWKKLFWKAKKIPEDQRANQANQFLMQIYKNEVQARYQLAVRGKKPEPPAGAIAALNTIIDGKRVPYVVTPKEAMKFMVGLLRPASIIEGQEHLIDEHLIQRALAKSGARVSDTEVEGWVREMRSRYEGPFNWDVILKVKGTTPDRERARWRHVQAWKRANGINPTDADIEAFRQKHDDFFRSRHVKVRHILVKFIDDMTGLSRGPAAEEAARTKAEKIHRLAQEGVEFERLAQLYSQDDTTSEGGGKIGQPIKKWGGGYDPEFQRVAYGLDAGELSGPVRSRYGYHVIQCDEVSPPTSRDIDWKDPRYADWVLEEYETKMMEDWMQEMRAKATIERASPEALLEVKNARFPEKAVNN